MGREPGDKGYGLQNGCVEVEMNWATASLFMSLILGLNTSANAQAAGEGVPDRPFETVHLMIVAPDQEQGLIDAVGDIDRSIAEAGCSACSYHLAKLFAGKFGQYNYMMTSAWPDRITYVKIHTSDAYGAAVARHPIMEILYKSEFYGRYVPVP